MHRWHKPICSQQSSLLNVAHHAHIVKFTRNLYASILLVDIILSNGSKELHSLTPYLNVLVDEILELCNRALFDAYQNLPFKCN